MVRGRCAVTLGSGTVPVPVPPSYGPLDNQAGCMRFAALHGARAGLFAGLLNICTSLAWVPSRTRPERVPGHSAGGFSQGLGDTCSLLGAEG